MLQQCTAKNTMGRARAGALHGRRSAACWYNARCSTARILDVGQHSPSQVGAGRHNGATSPISHADGCMMGALGLVAEAPGHGAVVVQPPTRPHGVVRVRPAELHLGGRSRADGLRPLHDSFRDGANFRNRLRRPVRGGLGRELLHGLLPGALELLGRDESAALDELPAEVVGNAVDPRAREATLRHAGATRLGRCRKGDQPAAEARL
mmetsp:Transcript_49854/g.159373  ORF Transcript_49854/g.159373 Transcript_49854/m.159373 type:complete len:208 (+) Transcript_49854:1390-2013(+)